jgi:uroporphyrinogen-III decarboxylase
VTVSQEPAGFLTGKLWSYERFTQTGCTGGYVLVSVHNIQHDVPIRNIIAMAEATRKYESYPLRC